MTPPPLPLEIFYRIISRVTSNNDLCALALCCRTLRDEAQRRLFRHSPRHNVPQQAKFLDAMNNSLGRLGPMVASYTIDLHPFAIYASAGIPTKTVAGFALSSMCNLSTLRILRYAASTVLDISTLLTCAFRLTSLEFGHYIDPLLFDFLRTQPSLRHLKLHGTLRGSIPTELLRDDLEFCPNLVSLSAEHSVLGVFLAEHRRIKHLHCGIPWHSMGDELISVKASQLPSVEHIALRIHIDQPNLSFLQNIPSLIRLDIVDHRYQQASQLFYILENTPQIRHLVLMVIPTETVEDKVVETARAVFKMRPALEHVDIIYSAHGRNTFVRFYTPAKSGKMERRTLPLEDFYVGNEFV
ncbi:hypothetical protein D9619_009496 [Psilocybe cf. subviscida]|uniref:F-box domain-containing protein n=1 Tax=Psilocybe cf. subviscida TaxID=2480587 RepID=A0A8H5BVR5_9AGAR|nr:hypothetical protein D9619_009496 [Psilocybe cf. subviscida]